EVPEGEVRRAARGAYDRALRRPDQVVVRNGALVRMECPALAQRHRVPFVLRIGQLDLIPRSERAVPAKTHAERVMRACTRSSLAIIRPARRIPGTRPAPSGARIMRWRGRGTGW